MTIQRFGLGKRYSGGFGMPDIVAKVDGPQPAEPAPKCDGNHGGPRCADPECWNDDVLQPTEPVVKESLTTADSTMAGDVDPTSKEQYRRMFNAACVALGAINERLDLDPNDGGSEPIIDAVEDLKEQIEQTLAADAWLEDLHRLLMKYGTSRACQNEITAHACKRVQPASGEDLTPVLRGVIGLAKDAYAFWDEDRDMKVGKILSALSGFNAGYDRRADAMHKAMQQEPKP